MGKLAIFLFLFTLLLGAFLYALLLQEPVQPKTSQAPQLYPHVRADDLGKTPGKLQEKYPNLFLSQDRNGLMVGQHKFDNAQYIIWFVLENKDYRAFRIKASRTYSKLEDKEMLSYFGSLYGRPFDAVCRGNTTVARQSCHYKWWVKDRVSLDVLTREKSDKSISLDAITTDSYLSTKHHNAIRRLLPAQ
ncbi:MAG: hypothetical protein HWE30_03115 [Methylocystaceae bacterium]|nr:hypothetical protein [Methylocystaceae bacterium]